MSKIQNPTVLIMKRDNSDTYAVAITNASDNFHDAKLMASMEPDMRDDVIDTWSKTGTTWLRKYRSFASGLKY